MGHFLAALAFSRYAFSSNSQPSLLRAIASYDVVGDKQTRLALQLLALTFVRTNELIGAVWTEFNLDERVWVIPAERMKMRAEHIVPLSTQTIALLAELKPISGTSQYLLPGRLGEDARRLARFDWLGVRRPFR
jgi:integrase